MTLEEIKEFISLLESETPTDHFGWLRLRKDVLTCRMWLDQVPPPTPVCWAEVDLDLILAKANAAITGKAASRWSGLCLGHH
jgi:hypothetical protein